MEPEHQFAPQGVLNGQALWHSEKANCETPTKTSAEFTRKLARPIATTDALAPASPGE
jgi:hypothetical protein